MRLHFFKSVDHLLCTDPGVVLLKSYINFASFHGMIMLVFSEHHETVMKILAVIYHSMIAFTREEVLELIGPNYKVLRCLLDASRGIVPAHPSYRFC